MVFPSAQINCFRGAISQMLLPIPEQAMGIEVLAIAAGGKLFKFVHMAMKSGSPAALH